MADAFEKYVNERPEITPTIYAYKLNGVVSHEGYIKVGYTERDAAVRIKEQLHTSGVPYTILERICDVFRRFLLYRPRCSRNP